ncbi:unnamed protein product [Prorocentrum cordatum]|uniref:Cellulase n=1 Tax=Prorocentrum cordatum TaxID=2364126 RepID=A0ABN9X2T4_9DINO|nr:unnamed protein product [Polarella glacialis]|mmetsp:Transcript_28693/g.80482  ORF Transcript_28693/g.80482 Transcript_28693/m.80482 type:complete len:103 (+) Transcript_28693:3-311(+)
MNDRKCNVVLKDAVPADAVAGFSFVCDTCGWYHGDGGSGFPASAGSGGCHSYLFLKGTAPCSSYGPCDGCVSPAGEVVHTFRMNNTCDRDCSGETVPCGGLR